MKSLVIFLLLVISNISLANSIFSPSKVTKIILHDGGMVYVYLDGTVVTEEECSNKGAITLAPSNQHYSSMYSAILAAYHSGTSIGGWVDLCDERINSPILTRLDLLPK